MDWPILFIICFVVGAGFVVLSMVFGELFSALESGVGAGTIPFKPLLIAMFLTIFGGLGLIGRIIFPGADLFVAMGATFIGIFAALIIYRGTIAKMIRWQNTNTHDKKSLVGHAAKVVEAIAQGGYGKITYSINQKIVSGPAKSENGAAIERNAPVEIVGIEKSTYVVRKIN
ncbi:MAG: hypothetical protein FWB71_03135 [Defluviitaleaceae bacterium]|nr:hypothetical protein [Defluviitaleaceae bacterium]